MISPTNTAFAETNSVETSSSETPAADPWAVARERLRRELETRGWSQRALARRAKAAGAPLQHSQLSRFLSGSAPDLATVEAIARALDIDLLNLLGGDSSTGSGQAADATYQRLPLRDLHPDPEQPRKDFDMASLRELAESIDQYGLLQPLRVRPYPDRPGLWMVVAGERRLRALLILKEAGRLDLDLERGVPCTLRPAIEAGRTDLQADVQILQHTVAELDAAEEALIENVQRRDLTVLEEAEAYARLVGTGKRHPSAAHLAERLGLGARRVQQVLALTELPEAIKEALRDGILDFAKARALHGHPADVQAEALRRIGAGQIHTRDQLAAWLRDRAAENAEAGEPDTPQSDLEDGRFSTAADSLSDAEAEAEIRAQEREMTPRGHEPGSPEDGLPPPKPTHTDPAWADDGGGELRAALADAPRVALDLLAASMLQAEAAVTVRPALEGKALSAVGKAYEANTAVHNRMIPVHDWPPLAAAADAVWGKKTLHTRWPVDLYAQVRHLTDAELWELLARLTIVRVGGLDAEDWQERSLINCALLHAHQLADAQGDAEAGEAAS